jgi:hypothetical protein
MESVGLRMAERTPAVAGLMAKSAMGELNAHGLIGLVCLGVIDLVLFMWSCKVVGLGERYTIARWPIWERIVRSIILVEYPRLNICFSHDLNCFWR